MKYRRNKVKREHGIIKDALNWLEELTQNPEVTDVIPGVIEVSRSPERGIIYKYETKTGCKLLLKSNGSIQEAFVVTKNPEWVKLWVEERFPSDVKRSDKQNPNIQKQSAKNVTKYEELCGRKKENFITALKQNSSKLKHNKKRQNNKRGQDFNSYLPEWLEPDATDEMNVEECLDSSTRSALRNLKADLMKTEKKKHKNKS